MPETIEINKKVFVLGVILASILVISGFTAFAYAAGVIDIGGGPGTGNVQKGPKLVAAWDCPTKSGSCTPGDYACDEDLGPQNSHACEYKCGTGGTWGGANECSTNACYGAKCDQGSIYHEAY